MGDSGRKIPNFKRKVFGEAPSKLPKKYCADRQLEEVLAKPPPNLEYVDEFEVYQLDKNGKRWRRVCGRNHLLRLPPYVPEGVANPHNVANPREAYKCTNVSYDDGSGLGRFGWCEEHMKRIPQIDGVREAIKKRMADMSGGHEGTTDITSLQEWVDKVQESMTVDDLLDGTRLLYEMEALREMAKDFMEKNGYDQEQADYIASLMFRQTEMRLKMAKTDNELLKNQALSAVLRVILNGVIAIIENKLGPAEAAAVLTEFKKNLIIPITEQGYSEVLRRQQASGMSEPIAIDANQFRVIDRE